MQRIHSVDICRLIAIFAVIIIHTQPFAPLHPDLYGRFGETGWVINQAARFAVPFFFIISGYFWSLRQRTSTQPLADTLAMARRIAIIFLAWTAIYLLPFDIAAMARLGWSGPLKMTYWNMAALAEKPGKALMQGSQIHLWFLPALLSALAVCAILLRRRWYRALALIAIVLYVGGMLASAYARTPLGWSAGFEVRNGPVFSTLLFATGVYLSRLTSSPRWLAGGLLLFCAGMGCQIGEMYYLSHYYGVSPYLNFTVGTYFMGLGFALVALSNHRWLQGQRLSAIGRYTLGIYAIHFVFVDVFRGVRAITDSALWQLAYPLLVLLLSIMAALLMARSRLLRRIIA